MRGSPRIFRAAHILYTNPGIDVSDAMKLAGYTKREIAKLITASSTNTKANVSDNTDTTMTNGGKKSHTTMPDSNKSRVASARESIKPRTKAFAKVIISKKSRCTPSQVKATDAERNASITLLQSAYK